ncbi:MAG: hypothetical protein COB39_04030 [Marinosulfonomonas sp.]|nr:MAG: hypothetical protein COB39_04030 [Marinosulfonomonas sp.]
MLKDTSHIVENLNTLDPGILPQDVFEAIARLVVVPKAGAETYDAANLPSDVISTDLPRIERAVTAFERLKMF